MVPPCGMARRPALTGHACGEDTAAPTAQVYGGLVFMDFSAEATAELGRGRYISLDPAVLPPLWLIYRREPEGGDGQRGLGAWGRRAGGQAGSCLCSDQLCIKGSSQGTHSHDLGAPSCSTSPSAVPCSPAAPPGKDSGRVHATVKQLWVAGDAATR